jgi:ketosteroid isomerase-like protein
MNPADVARALIDAENIHDVQTVLDLFAPDTVADLAMGERLTTTADIRRWQEQLAAEHFHLTPHELLVEGQVVTWTGVFTLDRLKAQGTEAVHAQWKILVRDGKIELFDVKIISQDTSS